MKEKILFGILMSIIFLSCTKEDNHFVVTGKVFNSVTKKAIVGADVILVASPASGFVPTSSGVTSCKTGADGSFKIEFEYNKKSTYNVNVYANGYEESIMAYHIDYDDGPKHRFISYLNEDAYLKIHVKNVNPYNERDVISIIGPAPRICFEYDGIFGANVDQFIVDCYEKKTCIKLSTDPRGIPIEWYVTRNNVKKFAGSDTFFLTANDTTIYNIEY